MLFQCWQDGKCMVDCASYPNITQLYFTDNWNLSVCALFQLLLEQTKPWKSSLKFNTKFRTEKYDLDLRKGFSMEKMAQTRQI
jgi:hypothetical protein